MVQQVAVPDGLLCVPFADLVPAARYLSWSLPFAVILIVPMCLLTSTRRVCAPGQDVNVLTKIGVVMRS